MTGKKPKNEEWENDLRNEMISSYSSRNSIDRVLSSSQMGMGQDKRENLGQNKEDILYLYKKKEIQSNKIYKEIIGHIRKREPKRIIIHSDLPPDTTLKIMKEANKASIPFTILNDPTFEGEAAIVLIRKS